MADELVTSLCPPSCPPPECDPRNYARYYDSPEGCDIDKKVMVASRYGLVTGLVLGTYDVLMFSHVVEFGAIMKRYARHVVPLALMGATFAAASSAALRIRNLDDKLNYFLGGLACGPLVALYTGSGHGFVAGGLVLGVIGLLKKEAIETNTAILPYVPGHMNSITGWKRDWTLAQDPRDEYLRKCLECSKAIADRAKEAKRKKEEEERMTNVCKPTKKK